ncbi:MAG: hypothetical protein K8I30_13050, partial [Anaerolineae bacterium]|nr:hypothetical protein [Anaerolineae bacterium]
MLKILLLAVAFVLAQGRLSDVIDFADVLDDYAAVDSALALAPDGARAAWAAPDGLCIYTFAEESADCTPWPEMFRPGFDRYHRLNWSPDGSRLAFTENLFVRLNDSDIWVYDLAAGTFTNRTDDGETRVLFDGPQKRQLDYAPLWADDGSLYFFRSAGFQEGDAMALYRLPADSDTPKLVLD